MTTIAQADTRTLADLLHAYRRDYLPRKAPTTQYHEGLFYAWIEDEMGSIPLVSLTALVLRSWRDSLRDRYAPNSIRRYMTALSAVFTAAVDDYEWMTKHPLRRVSKPPAPPHRERCLTAEELPRLLAACQQSVNGHLHMVVCLALATAARKNELLQRRWNEMDLERRLLSIPRSKNGERRAVPLIQHVVALLQDHRTQYRSLWVFPRRDGRKPVLIDHAWWQACDRAGLTDFHFQDLRHTSATYLAMSGATIQEISEILGHKSLNQTKAYIHLIEPHTRGVLQKMGDQFLAGLLVASTMATLAAVGLNASL